MELLQSEKRDLDFSRLIFLHIPKAGGTTLHNILDRIYAPVNLRAKSGMVSKESILGMEKDAFNNLFLVKGHMHFGLHGCFPNEKVKYLTFLRDPVDRVVSHYFFVKRTPGHYLYKVVNESNMSLLEYALSDLTWELDNGQVRNLIEGGGTNIKLTVESLNDAKSNLKKWFALVGITERFDESLIVMKRILGWKEFPCYKKLNAAKEKHDIPEEMLNKIAERNALDIELYKWALTEFERNIGAHEGFDAEIELFQKMNQGFKMGFEEGKEEGTRVVYSKYILLRAERLLKRKFAGLFS